MPILTKIGGCALLLALAVIPIRAQVDAHTIRMDVVHGRPYVMVEVNGQGPFRFLIDTGTGGQAIVTDELADLLHLPVIGHTRLTDTSGLGEQRSETVLIDSLHVAGAEFTGVNAIRHMLYGEDQSCQGLLGFTLFKDYLLTLDYPDQRMTLAAGALTADGESTVIPFRMPDGVPIAALQVGDQKVEALFDSAGTGISLPQQLASRLKFASDPVAFGNIESVSTRFQIMAARLGSNVRLGRYTFDRPFVEINPAFPLVNFGSYPMHVFSITFDQTHLLVRLESSQKTLHLAETPLSAVMQNAPNPKPPDPKLVPVG
jgi:predicted aspartyl protease